ncbi:hypothetical protein VTL71DRAFT_5837 [Oculimacula yallundae]|uniref:UBC core domain-containing protein n=1 Tax=Oculimacula yallundae TaxID=86028 RepID=A0ABR4BYR6_9HELO
MEIAGLGIGVASIVGLVSTGLDMLCKVDAARDRLRSIGIVRTKLRNLSSSNGPRRIRLSLAGIIPFITPADHPSSPEDRFTALMDHLAAEQRNTTLWRLTQWAIRDEKKLSKIVQDLTTLVEDLYKMAGTSYEIGFKALVPEEASPYIVPVRQDPDVSSEDRHESVPACAPVLAIESSIQHATLNEVLLDAAEEADIYSASPLRKVNSAGLSIAAHKRDKSAGSKEETSTLKPTTPIAFQPAHECLDPDPPLRRFENIIEANQAAMQEAQRRMAWEASNSVLQNTTTGDVPATISKRLLKEIQDQNKPARPITELSTYWSIMDDNILRIIGTVKGPEDTPWVNGYFHLMIDVYPDHPFKMPECHFITKILHPDVETSAGKLCQVPGGNPKEFFTNWRPSQRITHLLEKALKNMIDHQGVSEFVGLKSENSRKVTLFVT